LRAQEATRIKASYHEEQEKIIHSLASLSREELNARVDAPIYEGNPISSLDEIDLFVLEFITRPTLNKEERAHSLYLQSKLSISDRMKLATQCSKRLDLNNQKLINPVLSPESSKAKRDREWDHSSTLTKSSRGDFSSSHLSSTFEPSRSGDSIYSERSNSTYYEDEEGEEGEDENVKDRKATHHHPTHTPYGRLAGDDFSKTPHALFQRTPIAERLGTRIAPFVAKTSHSTATEMHRIQKQSEIKLPPDLKAPSITAWGKAVMDYETTLGSFPRESIEMATK
jgi:hypothetical protein